MTQPQTLQTVGDLTVTTFSDGFFNIPPEFFPNTHGLGADPVRFGANLWLIRKGDRQILVDTGSGPYLKERFATGDFADQRSEHGVDAAAITDIVLTHMHADHIGGLMLDGASVYPNATIHVQEAEWAFWTNPDLPNQVPDDQKPMVGLLQMIAGPVAGQVTPHAGDADLGDGLTLIPAPGHTPGHAVLHVASGDDQLMILGDALVSGALQFARPDITYALDSDPDRAVATRHSLLDRLAADGTPAAFTHLDHPGIGRVVRSGDAFGFEPV